MLSKHKIQWELQHALPHSGARKHQKALQDNKQSYQLITNDLF